MDPTIFNASDVSAADYLVIGLATCFLKADGEVHEVQIAEPIPSSALEAIVKGIPTSYQLACGIRLGAVLIDEKPRLPESFPPDAQLCDEFVERAIAATRTYQARPLAQNIIPEGTIRDDFNFSVERKRVLNSERIVRTEDNVKQHSHTHEVL